MATLLYAFVVTYAAVLVSELVGDRSAYAVGALAARHGVRAVLAGVLPAFMLKTFAAVLFGHLLSGLPRGAIAALSAATFAGAALHVWRTRDEAPPLPATGRDRRRGALAAFLAIALSEWADIGQLTTAAMVAQFGAPVVVWCAAVASLMTKAALAAMLGARLGQRIDRRRLVWGATGLFVAMGVLAVMRVE